MSFRGPGLLLIENVGNLVRPSSYELGEAAKIVLFSVTEGEDEPLKYPSIFHRASLMILTKTDLLPDVDFSPSIALENARQVHPKIDCVALSSRTGNGFDQRLRWLNAL